MDNGALADIQATEGGSLRIKNLARVLAGNTDAIIVTRLPVTKLNILDIQNTMKEYDRIDRIREGPWDEIQLHYK